MLVLISYLGLIGIDAQFISIRQTSDTFGKCCVQAWYVILAVGRVDSSSRNIRDLGMTPPMWQVPTFVEGPSIGSVNSEGKGTATAKYGRSTGCRILTRVVKISTMNIDEP